MNRADASAMAALQARVDGLEAKLAAVYRAFEVVSEATGHPLVPPQDPPPRRLRVVR